MYSADSKTYLDLKASDVVCLWTQIAAGSNQALDQIIDLNVRLITKIAAKFYDAYGHRLEYDDLFQTAMLGFVKAVTMLDTDKLSLFPAYATKCIVNTLKQYTRQMQPCLGSQDGKDWMSETENELYRVRVDDFYHCIERCDLENAMHFLTDRERVAIRHTFFEERTDTETAILMNISKRRVGQLKESAVKRLWRVLTNDGEFAYGFTDD